MKFLLALVAAVVLAGCCSPPCFEVPAVGNCCQSWDWYKECDLVEGREYRQCRVCDNPMAYEGMIVQRSYAVPAPVYLGTPAPEGAPVEAPPASCGK